MGTSQPPSGIPPTDIRPRYERLLTLARECDAAGVAELLAAGVPPEPVRELADTALHLAADNGHPETLRTLLSAGADPLRLDRKGSAALHRAALKGRLSCVIVLLDEGVDPNLPDRHGRTALQEAVQGASLETVRLLIDRGADLNIEDRFGRSALAKVYDKIEDDQVAKPIAAALLEAGADPRRMDVFYLCVTPLMLALADGDFAAARRSLRADPASINIDHFRLGTALHIAARHGAVRPVRWLLKNGADAARQSEDGTPLQCAAARGHAAVVRVLLEAAPQSIRAGSYGQPPALSLAARSGDLPTVILLIRAGADPRTITDEMTARDYAANAAVRERLRHEMVSGNPRPQRCPLVNAPALARLLASEGEASPRLPAVQHGKRPLHCAAGAAAVDVIERLLDAGADLLDYEVPDGWPAVAPLASARLQGMTRRKRAFDGERSSLHVCLSDFADGLAGGMRDIDWRNATETEILARFEAQPWEANAHYVDALTPLHMAAAFDLPEVVSLLINLGACLEKCTHIGETPLTFAARRAGRETVRRLVQAGADLGNGNAATPPLHEACRSANAAAADVLIGAGADVNAAAGRLGGIR